MVRGKTFDMYCASSVDELTNSRASSNRWIGKQHWVDSKRRGEEMEDLWHIVGKLCKHLSKFRSAVSMEMEKM